MGTARASLASDWSCGCAAQCGAVLLAEPLHGHNTEASTIPGHPVTLHTRPTEHSQDPAAPLTQPTASPGTLWHLSPVPAVSLGTPHCLQLWLPAVPITCCSEAELWALLHCYLSPSASSWHHSPPCTAGARASSSSQAWQAGRRRQLSLVLKGDRASSFPARQVPDRS